MYIWPHQIERRTSVASVQEYREIARERVRSMSIRMDAQLSRFRDAILDFEAAATRAQARNIAWTTFRWLMGFPIDDTPYRIPGTSRLGYTPDGYRLDWPRRTTMRRRVLWIYA